MITRLFIFLTLTALSFRGLCQADSVFHFIKDYRGGISDFTVDNLGNLYFVYQNGQLKKWTGIPASVISASLPSKRT